MQIIKTLVVDDDTRFRALVRDFLASEPDIAVIGEANDAQQAIRQARSLKPDVVLMDVRMQGMNGINATHQLRKEMPALKVIMLTVFDVKEYMDAAMASGASGYVVKKALTTDLLPAIREASEAA